MPKRERLLTEQEHHRRAFEIYAALEGRRSYEAVARQMGVSLSSTKLWARSFGWQARLKQREATLARQTADRVLETRSTDHDQYRKVVRMALIKVAKAINADKVRVQVADLDRLVRLEQYLDETDAKRSPTDYAHFTEEQLKARLRELILSLLREFPDLRDELIAMANEQSTAASPDTAGAGARSTPPPAENPPTDETGPTGRP
jgi:hypothetical protein